MDILSKLFGNPMERHAKHRLKETKNEVERTTRPLAAISMAIVKGSDFCFQGTKSFIDNPDQKERQVLEIYLWYEYLFFFLHLTMRSAFVRLNEEQTKDLEQYVCPVVVTTAIDTFCEHWPEEVKQGLRAEFYERLNKAEVDYSSAKELMSPSERTFSEDSVISKLAMRVHKVISNSTVPIVFLTVVNIAARAVVDIKLDALVDEAAKVLPLK